MFLFACLNPRLFAYLHGILTHTLDICAHNRQICRLCRLYIYIYIADYIYIYIWLTHLISYNSDNNRRNRQTWLSHSISAETLPIPGYLRVFTRLLTPQPRFQRVGCGSIIIGLDGVFLVSSRLNPCQGLDGVFSRLLTPQLLSRP